ncbi:MAG: Ig-like domain-containing protein [Pseudomonadota bacterium]
MEYMDCRGYKNRLFIGVKQLLLLMSLLVSANAFAEEPVCAEVKVEIQQELTLERQAFDAMMRINNGLDTLAIENIAVSVNFADENGNPVLATSDPNETNPDAKFFIRIDTMDGIADVSGNGVVAPNTSGEIHWLIIPIPGAAEGAPGGKLYYIGAHLSYTIGGELEEVDVTPDFITVKPLPQLALDYFLTRDVVGDDAFTAEVELPEPYTLGLRINNKGTGPANNVAIDSGQPKITENEQGLLIGFTIIGSTLDDQPAQPDLKMNFGDIEPASSRVGRWIMETTLSGEFTDFTASVSHSDELGGAVTSLIDNNDINTHYLLRDVRVDLPGRDSVRDFLAFSVGGDIDNLTVYESDTVDSEVSNISTSATLVLDNVSGTESYYTLSIPVQPGFVYARLVDPFDGTKAIKSIVRSDGKVISPDNGWNSKTRDRNTNPPSWEHWLNLFDVNTTGIYILHIGEADVTAAPPVLQFIDDKVSAEGKQVGFLVEASDVNQDAMILTASPLPAGASFVDNGDGTAHFNWMPSEGQAGVYSITYKASDGTLSDSQSATIKINPAWDSDGDGLDDAWEMEHFGSLDNDGSGDTDGDGVSDLDEYLNGTDPTLPPPAVPSLLEGSSGNGESTLSWSTVDGADSYRLYWSELPGVTQDNSGVIDDVSSPTFHSGLVNGTTYHYALSAVGAGGESALSQEVAVTPGNRDWGIPGLVVNDSGVFADVQIASAENGAMIAVWTQSDGLHQNVWGSIYHVGSGWGTPQLIELDDTSDARELQIDMDEAGNALVAWRAVNSAEESVWANSYTADGGWGTPAQLISGATGSLGELAIGMSGDGSGLLIWSQAAGGTTAPNSVWSSHYAAATWSTAARIDTATVSGVNGLQLGVAAEGSALAVWSQTSDTTSYDLIAANYSGAAWQGAQTLRSAMVGDASAPQVTAQLAMNAGGEAVLVWGEAASPNSIYAQRYLPASGWSSNELIEFDTTSGAYQPSVAIDLNGNAVVTWLQSDGSNSAVYSNRYTVGSGWAASAEKISADSAPAHVGDAVAPMVSMDRLGSIVVLWQQDDSVQSNIWSNRYESGNGWSSALIIETRNAGDAVNPQLAMNDSGDALGVWSQTDGQGTYLVFNDFVSGNEGVPNIAPVVVLPAEVSADEETVASLSASGSFDQDGNVASYSWSQLSGPAVTLSGADSANVSFIAPTLIVADVVTLRALLTDNEGESAYADVAVQINPVNLVPTVSAGSDVTVDEGTTVSLDGSADDSDGSIISYQWTQISGSAVALEAVDVATTSFVAPTVKTEIVLQFQLSVEDNEGAFSIDVVSVTVSPVNHAPLVNAGDDQTIDEQAAVTLSGTASDPDADGILTSYAWTQLSGTPVTLSGADSLNASFTAPTLKQAAVLSFRLTVTDDEGGVSFDEMVVTVNPVNHPPVVSAGNDQSVDEQTVVSLTGTASDPDADGVLSSYAWTQVAGTTVALNEADTLSVSFTAPTLKEAAVLGFRLTVTDDEGGTSFDEVAISVNPVNHAPVVSAGEAQVVGENTQVSLAGVVSDPDADGIITQITWTQISGPSVSLNSADTASASFAAPAVYQDTVLGFRLYAKDDEGGETESFTEVTIYSTNPDDDADGMADLWEIQYFNTLSRDGTGDMDSDGATDLMEFGFETDPTVPQGPGQPSILTPDGTETTILTPTLTLSNGEHHPAFEVSYEFEVYSDAAMSQRVTNAVEIAEGSGQSSWVVDQPLQDNTWYYWRARAVGWVLVSEWVSSRFFVNTVNDAPEPFFVSAPASGVWVDTFTPNLSVTNSRDVDEDALSYGFNLYGNISQPTLLATVEGLPPEVEGSTTWAVDLTLEENTWYLWEAVATDEHGAQTSTQRASFFVNTVNDAPGLPTLHSPQPNEEVTTLLVALVVGNAVEPEDEAVTYFFELDKVNTFDSADKRVSGSIAEKTDLTDWEVTNLEDNTLYHWRVKASDGRAESAWEMGSFFTNTVNDAPGVPMPQNPGSGAWVGSLTPTLSVYPAVDVDRDSLTYDYEVYRANNRWMLGELYASDSNQPEWWQLAPQLEDAGWYYWRARAVDEHGLASEWNELTIFYADDDGVNDPPQITLKKLKSASSANKQDLVEIHWVDRDPDSNATISLYYDTDSYGENGILLTEGLLEDPDGQGDRYEWNISAMSAGVYYLYAVIDDGSSRVVEYSPNAVIVGDGGGHPFIQLEQPSLDGGKKQQWAQIQWNDLDSNSSARISLYYRTADVAQDTLIVSGLDEDSDGNDDKYKWDVSVLPSGEYWVYAVIKDEQSSYTDYAEGQIVINRK